MLRALFAGVLTISLAGTLRAGPRFPEPPGIPPDSFCKIQVDKIAAEVARLRSDDDAEVVAACREIAKLYG